ncbi:hypothetical protein AVEN_39156-1 [Araneus ventricosus]|uniref:Uncharacterized protein n=1 Tax=Araneus ventricosus TaxID=182803 RepID=A0A4Y2VUN1_ARAVE|nr:hypothetical protein AVEN_39156-1 [Araneus ventricosus]
MVARPCSVNGNSFLKLAGKKAEAVSSPSQRSSPGIRLTRSNWETLIRRQNRGEPWKRTRKRLTRGVGQGKWCVERGSGPQPNDPDRFPCLPNNFCAHSPQVETPGPDTRSWVRRWAWKLNAA